MKRSPMEGPWWNCPQHGEASTAYCALVHCNELITRNMEQETERRKASRVIYSSQFEPPEYVTDPDRSDEANDEI